MCAKATHMDTATHQSTHVRAGATNVHTLARESALVCV